MKHVISPLIKKKVIRIFIRFDPEYNYLKDINPLYH